MTDVERVRAAADIVAVVDRYVKLSRVGIQRVGLCPFHKEKSPSFYVHPMKQVFHCHGCGAGGDVFSFVQQIEACDFPRALRIVADDAGVSIDARPLTREEKSDYAAQAEWRQLLEHFRLRFGSSEKLAPAHLKWSCDADPGFREWLQEDLAHVHVITGMVVAILAQATSREEAAA